MTLGDQIEALLRRLLETEGVEILLRKLTEGDHILPAKRRRIANTKNVAAPRMRDGQEQETSTASENEKGDGLRPMLGVKQVLKIVPVSRSTLERMINREIPQVETAVWFEDEVKAWQEALDEGRKPGG